jgi:hypothetical protein
MKRSKRGNYRPEINEGVMEAMSTIRSLSIREKAGFAVAVIVTLLLAAALAARPASADHETLVEERNYTVRENSYLYATGLQIRTGDRVVFTASGTIWPAGKLNPFYPPTGPDGYTDTDCSNPDSQFPAPCERKFSLLGQIDTINRAGGWFFIGSSSQRVYSGAGGWLYLRTNDDVPNNGEGAFELNVKVYRDITPPETTISSGPSGTVNTDSANFAFSSSEAGSSFQCSLDSSDPASFTACSSPKPYTGLEANRSHTFRVRAIDATGNVDPTPAERTWSIDTTPPTVMSVSPADKATGVALTANVSATFSEAMKGSTVERAFTLEKKNPDGTTEPVAATVDYKAVQQKAVLDPNEELASATKYIATVTTRAKDKAGNALAQNEVWSFTTTN